VYLLDEIVITSIIFQYIGVAIRIQNRIQEYERIGFNAVLPQVLKCILNILWYALKEMIGNGYWLLRARMESTILNFGAKPVIPQIANNPDTNVYDALS
jgi:hypothetical protein